jgi:serine protease Do
MSLRRMDTANPKALLLAAAGALVTVVAGCGSSSGRPDREGLVEQVSRGVVEIRDASDGWGTGFVVDQRRGLVLTAAHVVAGLDELKVRYGDQIVSARLHGEIPCDDLALLQVDALPSATRALSFGDSATVKAGQPVAAFGFPDTLQSSSQTERLVSTFGFVTADGTVEATTDDSVPKYASVIQHQAPTAPGSSGGPIVDESGRVIGMEVAANSDAENQSYAISSNRMKRLLPKLARGKFVAYIGIFVEPPDLRTDDEVRDMKWKIKTPKDGVAIYTIDSGSPAERHNFYFGDYIHDVNRKVVNSMADLCDVLQSHEGEVVTIRGKEVDSGRQYAEPVKVR